MRSGRLPSNSAYRPNEARPIDIEYSSALWSYHDEALTRRLARTERYRALRRLESHPMDKVAAGAIEPRMRTGIVLSIKTTGRDRRLDDIVEIGMVSFTFDESHRIHDVVGIFGAWREPRAPLPSERSRVMDVTPGMIIGQTVCVDAVAAFVAHASIIIAHDARLARPLCERAFPCFQARPWACSATEIPWRTIGYESSHLEHLVNRVGTLHGEYRAADNCYALLEGLAAGPPDVAETPFQMLMRSVSRAQVEVSAENSPFRSKELLKARGYRWCDGSDGRARCWRKEIDEADVEAELRFLRESVYEAAVEVPCRRIEAAHRYR